MKTVSCIIPAYNEEARIGAVLKAAALHPLVREIIVVDDGSTDGTRQAAAVFAGVRLIALSKNSGKSAAVAEGVRSAKGEFIFLLDADLSGLEKDAITALIAPVVDDKADMSISLRGNAPALWRLLGLDYLSGERVFRKAFIEPLLGELSALHGFGLEVYMNRVIVKKRMRLAVVSWKNVGSALKYAESQPWWYLGLKKDFIRMAFLVMHTITPFEALWQIISMRRLRVDVRRTE